MDIAIQLKKRNLEMIDHRQHVLGGTYIFLIIRLCTCYIRNY